MALASAQALGKTYGSRLLTVVFTVRANRIGVISAAQ